MHHNSSFNNKNNRKDHLDETAIQKSSNEKTHPKTETDSTPKVEQLPLGSGYKAEHLPTKVIKPEVLPLDESIPDLLKSKKLADLSIDDTDLSLDDPVPAPEDEFYDFDKDIYGDETEFKPDL